MARTICFEKYCFVIAYKESKGFGMKCFCISNDIEVPFYLYFISVTLKVSIATYICLICVNGIGYLECHVWKKTSKMTFTKCNGRVHFDSHHWQQQ